MKKIKTVFKIDRETNLATQEVNKGVQWVIEGKGIATLKVDGSACMVQGGELYKRYDRKLKSQFVKQVRANPDTVVTSNMFNELPGDAIPCQEKPDPVTYHHPHWVKIDKTKPEDKFHLEALSKLTDLPDGTYELIGAKVNGNPYNLQEHLLVKHGAEVLNVPDRSFEGLKTFLEGLQGEGIVFHNQETGEMAKARRKDMCDTPCKLKDGTEVIAWSTQGDIRNQRENNNKPKMKK